MLPQKYTAKFIFGEIRRLTVGFIYVHQLRSQTYTLENRFPISLLVSTFGPCYKIALFVFVRSYSISLGNIYQCKTLN